MKALFDTNILIDYLGRSPPFKDIPTGEFVLALKHQIADGHHVCAFRGDRLVGYCGWLETTVAIGEKWKRGEGELRSVAGDKVSAAALTVMRSDVPDALTPMIRTIRTRPTRGARTTTGAGRR